MDKPGEAITSVDRVDHFDRVDQAANPAFFTQFMDKSHTLPSASIYRQRMFELLEVRPAAHVQQLGCGAGNDVQDLAKLVGTNGRLATSVRSWQSWASSAEENSSVSRVVGRLPSAEFETQERETDAA